MLHQHLDCSREVTTPSGFIVRIRPRTYSQWEDMENKRADYEQQIANARKEMPENEGYYSLVLRLNRQFRTERLNVQVMEFDEMKKVLPLSDIAWIETQLDKLDGMEIPLGNSPSGGSGNSTTTSQSSATPAATATEGKSKP
jgi:hypothetical protein